ncbi:hypothetical protein KKF59_02455 [Patescibacteria group bacterium]|nr:hypothetical protein [Patescibacteria group bacterium]MBU1034178.1 hypothetical protein [Patescibacteria group bacterium]MBU1629747.1 hypothetical protein [Patescibacteria group bacterium]MBU1907972.1 hypothetical protein [Patescibacteria group bacterium]
MAKNKMTDHDEELELSEADSGEEKATINALDTKFVLAKKLIDNLREGLAQLEKLMSGGAEAADIDKLTDKTTSLSEEFAGLVNDSHIVEGVFDGQNMVGSDGHQYLVPQNYASKSKLVEGDILKLTIQPSGGFVFKQIGPIERERIVGTLIKDENTQTWKVVAEGKKYSVLPASISYFKGQVGDDVVVLIPKSAPSRWAAVENVIKKS